jgi:hypothetical protein
MRVELTESARRALGAAPASVRKAFYKQAALLEANLRHPSLRAKKYDETKSVWQARVTLDWRFYFVTESNRYLVTAIIPHPK